MSNKEAKLQRLDRFMKLVESSQWVPSRREYPPVLTEEDEQILTEAWMEVARENSKNEGKESIEDLSSSGIESPEFQNEKSR